MHATEELTEILARRYPFYAVPGEDGWSIRFPDLPGCTSFAETWDQVGPMARASFELWVESEVEQGHPIPAPGSAPWDARWEPSGGSFPGGPTGAILTADDVAGRLGVSRRRVAALAAARGVGRMVGKARLFAEADVDALRPGPPGRPADPIGAENRRWFADRHPGASLEGGLAYTDPITTRKQAEPTGRYLITAFWHDADGQRQFADRGGATARDAVEALSAEIERQAQTAGKNGAGDLPGAAGDGGAS